LSILVNNINLAVEKIFIESDKLRKILSSNVKKHRKKLGLSQEKLAETANLSSQTINDIEGCRMWVSDKTIIKLATVFNIEAYQLLVPVGQSENQDIGQSVKDKLLLDLEAKIVGTIHREFEGIRELLL
jgi:DNA-binding XRE family transcriptional regulator